MYHNMKKLLSTLLIVTVLISLCSVSAMAAEPSVEQRTVTYFPDGSYMVKTITEANTALALSGTSTKSGSAIEDYFDASGKLLVRAIVNGTFEYDGTTAKATSASYGYKVVSSDWSFRSGSASCSGDTATATVRFWHGIIPHSLSVSLTCSATGVLS